MKIKRTLQVAALVASLALGVGTGQAIAGEIKKWDRTTGVCFMDDTNATTGEQHEPVYACVPKFDPDGVKVTRVWEDGSGTYGDGQWYFDPEQHGFDLAN